MGRLSDIGAQARGNCRPMISQQIGRVATGQTATADAVQTAGHLDPAFSGLARLAASACGTNLAALAVTGVGEVWCAPNGEPQSIPPSGDAFSSYTSHVGDLFEVPDTTRDERFRECELVTGRHGI